MLQLRHTSFHLLLHRRTAILRIRMDKIVYKMKRSYSNAAPPPRGGERDNPPPHLCLEECALLEGIIINLPFGTNVWNETEYFPPVILLAFAWDMRSSPLAPDLSLFLQGTLNASEERSFRKVPNLMLPAPVEASRLSSVWVSVCVCARACIN